MASYKSPSEVELVAIYRLEFYKKQKNWKFCKDLCKKKAAEPTEVPEERKAPVKSANSTKSILNKTYSLDPDVDPSDLNDAFLEPDPDKILPATPPDPTNLQNLKSSSKSISEPHLLDNQWPEPQQELSEFQKKWLESQKHLPELQTHPPESQQWSGSQLPWPEGGYSWPVANTVWSVPEVPEHGWPSVGQKWGGEEAYYPHAKTTREYEPHGEWPEPFPLVADSARREQAQPEAVLGEADAWLRGSPHWSEHEEAVSTSDSTTSFMRGAAVAPHSSEIDLNLSRTSSNISCSTAASLSSKQLLAGVSRHADALRTLLREARVRASIQQRPRSTLSVDYRTPNAFNLSCDDRPTRDIDLFQPHTDAFIAGSFKNQEPGRGRGRLHRERLIGIGMGRPYRL